jgi:hypothetical protein
MNTMRIIYCGRLCGIDKLQRVGFSVVPAHIGSSGFMLALNALRDREWL